MSICVSCNITIVETMLLTELRKKYIFLFRKLFPKKPIVINYCDQCYQSLINEMESEYQSQIKYTNNYQLILDNMKTKSGETKNVSRYEKLDNMSPKYIEIAKKFHETLSCPIIRIEKSNNPLLEKKFLNRSKKLGQQNIKYLFHGSNDIAYNNILETGFDMKYAAPTGVYGQGIYFAEEAVYSHNYGRVTKTQIGTVNHLLYCKVNLGRTYPGYTGLTQPPPGYDAVHSDVKTYCLFDNYQGIPEYIIYYQINMIN